MDFKNKIKILEEENFNSDYILKIGNLPIILTAVHTMKQKKDDGTIKLNEPFTKAIARYVSEKTNCSYFIKIKDTNIDSNSNVMDDFKINLLKYIKDNDIKLVIDLHGASINRDFDVEFGTLDNLSADFSTIKELEDSFYENGIKNIQHNTPFKGGGITKCIFDNTKIEAIQIEINRKFRDLKNPENIEKICAALISFIEIYTNYNN